VKWPHDNLPPEVQLAIDLAQRKFGAFVEMVGKDNEGRPLVYRELDAFMWRFAEEGWAAGAPVCLMIPTGFGKTTQIGLRVAWEIGRNPQLVVPFVTESFDESAKRVDSVRDILRDREYRLVFPNVRLKRGRDKAGSFELARDGFEKEPTVSSHGILTGTGLRSDLTVFDDIVTFRNAVLEPTNRERVYQSLRTTWISRGRRSGEARTRLLWIQTTYHGQDASARLRVDPTAGWWFLIVRAEPP